MSNSALTQYTQDEPQVELPAGTIPFSVKDLEMGLEFEQEIANNEAKKSAATHMRDLYIKSLRKFYNAPEGEYRFEGWARGFKKMEQPPG